MATEAQPVVEATDGQAKPGTEGTDARKAGDELDSLLAEFAAGTKTTPVKPETTTTPATTSPAEAKRLEAIERQLANDQMQRDLAPVIAKVKAGMPAEVFDDTEIEDWLDGRARRDPRLAEAWQNRHQNPKAWEKVATALGRQFADKFAKLPDKGATEDRAAVSAAVRGASTAAPEAKAPDYSRMSGRDFGDDVEKKFGYRPAGT